MKILFINGSPYKKGNTANLAAYFLKNKDYKTLNLIDYKIYSFGQVFLDDQFNEVLSIMKDYDVLVFGSPLYWHNICGLIRNFLDRTYDIAETDTFKGKRMFFILQGAAPERWMIDASEYTMKRFAYLSGMDYSGIITNKKDADALRIKIK